MIHFYVKIRIFGLLFYTIWLFDSCHQIDNKWKAISQQYVRDTEQSINVSMSMGGVVTYGTYFEQGTTVHQQEEDI